MSLLDEVQFSLICRPKVRFLSVLILDGKNIELHVYVMMTVRYIAKHAEDKRMTLEKAILHCNCANHCIHIAYCMYYKPTLYDPLMFAKLVMNRLIL